MNLREREGYEVREGREEGVRLLLPYVYRYNDGSDSDEGPSDIPSSGVPRFFEKEFRKRRTVLK